MKFRGPCATAIYEPYKVLRSIDGVCGRDPEFEKNYKLQKSFLRTHRTVIDGPTTYKKGHSFRFRKVILGL